MLEENKITALCDFLEEAIFHDQDDEDIGVEGDMFEIQPV